MRDIKQIMKDARNGCGTFEMTALEIIRVCRAFIPTSTPDDIEAALECSMGGGSTMAGRPVKVVG